MRTYDAQVAYAENLRKHPNADIKATGHCQGVARDIVGAQGWAPTALDAFNDIPAQYKHAVPVPGMIGYAAYRDAKGRPLEDGHAFVVAPYGYVYSTDLPHAGMLGLVPMTLITGKGGWNMPLLGFISWTPSGPIALKPTPIPIGLHEVVVGGRTPISRPSAIMKSGMSTARFLVHNPHARALIAPGTKLMVPTTCRAIHAGP